MSPESRSDDRKHYTMKTSRSPAAGRSHSHSKTQTTTKVQSHHRPSTAKVTMSGTPIASPRIPHSVGQSYPPKLSPSAAAAARRPTPAPEVRSPSPNYFGLAPESAVSIDPQETSLLPHNNWSPPSSSVKSFAAAIPQSIPLDANPEFEAFKRQIDANRGVAPFALSNSHFPATPMGGGSSKLSTRPVPPRWQSQGSNVGSASELMAARHAAATAPNHHYHHHHHHARARFDSSPVRMEIDADGQDKQVSPFHSVESKRTADSDAYAQQPPSFLGGARYQSPALLDGSSKTRTSLSKNEDRHPRLSMPQGKANPPSPEPRSARAESTPLKSDQAAPPMMSAAQLKEVMSLPGENQLLLLDVRVATHYSSSRIKGALNLCIPTTLLKRATFNLGKLQSTFHDAEDQARFAAWHVTKHLVVYDSSSSEKRDAVAATNMLKKFTNEGYEGHACILRGGFNHFATAYPQLIDHRSGAEISSGAPSLSLTSDAKRRPSLPPVIGGVALPNAGNNPNPFFSNIRQNMDLADGVGQMDIATPSTLDRKVLPRWLREVAEPRDHGKMVSDNFLHIELSEQKRMKNAYSIFIPPGSNGGSSEQVQLAGIEKGGKNRYKDILPFEHARVRLQGRPEGSCDYINASHIQASRSHKRYIASQGPLPATFEDFWTAIWEQDVRVVVMLTAESEGGQLKCHPYWKGREFGPIKLRCLSEKKVSLDLDKHRSSTTAVATMSSASGGSAAPQSVPVVAAELGRRRASTTTSLEGSSIPVPVQSDLSSVGTQTDSPYVIIRKFALSHTDHAFVPMREITHLHYPSWPDFGAPAQPSHLLALVELANVMQRAAVPMDTPTTLSSSTDSFNAFSRSTSSLGSASSLSRADPGLISWYDEPESEAQARPMLVHCSAGCGRTGTFCTVDSVIDMLKRQRMQPSKEVNNASDARSSLAHMTDNDGDVAMGDPTPVEEEFRHSSALKSSTGFPLRLGRHGSIGSTGDAETAIDTTWLQDEDTDLIARTVEDFRTQRLSMVQSLRQFVLCYETAIEWIGRLEDRPRGGRARSGSLQVPRGN